MKGFDIYFNNQKIKVAVRNGVAIVCFDNAEKMTISGIDHEKFQSLSWLETKLSLGDKIKIIASDIEEVNDPISKKRIDRQKLLTEYMGLKETLTKEGLLK